jgi:hypothetical protein
LVTSTIRTTTRASNITVLRCANNCGTGQPAWISPAPLISGATKRRSHHSGLIRGSRGRYNASKHPAARESITHGKKKDGFTTSLNLFPTTYCATTAVRIASHDCHRPDQIELFFDRQRPKMAQIPGQILDVGRSVKPHHNPLPCSHGDKGRHGKEIEIRHRKNPERPAQIESRQADTAEP